MAVALSLISSGNRALDIGCGEGAFAVALSSNIPSVSGVDISAAAVTIATERGIEANRSIWMSSRCLSPMAPSIPSHASMCSNTSSIHASVRGRSRAYAALARHSSLRRPTCVTGATGAALSADGSQKPRTTKSIRWRHLHYYTAANLRDLIAPWFEVTQVKGVPGGSHAGKSARLIRFLLPQRQAEEFACPGIALLARRKPTSAT